ncbi:MAG: alpha/beta fold hydrolase [Calditrichaeota bacterium]|nr:MAG: alpha/beta fold hydrolase [Calditrichota bacterium]
MPVHILELELHRRPVEILVPEETNPDAPLLILAHGAGNDMHSPFLSTIADHLQEEGIQVVRFNFPYKVRGKKVPDRSEVLEDSWRAVIEWVQENLAFSGLYIGGKSMGGRIAAMIAADVSDLKGLVFLGYPLHPPGKFQEIRDIFLYPLEVPMLFIQGTRDAFARMDLLQETLNRLRDRATLHWIEGGDHSYRVLVRSGRHYPEILKNVGHLVAGWIRSVQKAPASETA